MAAEKLQNLYRRNKYVNQIFVYGDSYSHYIIAIIVPEEEEIFGWADSHNLEKNVPILCENQELKDLILEELTTIANDQNVK